MFASRIAFSTAFYPWIALPDAGAFGSGFPFTWREYRETGHDPSGYNEPDDQ
jgi:hypothetical protein